MWKSEIRVNTKIKGRKKQMVKTNLTVEDFEDKKYGEGKTAGRYTRFKTSDGWLSSFDKPAIEKLKDACGIGKAVSVDVLTDKNGK